MVAKMSMLSPSTTKIAKTNIEKPVRQSHERNDNGGRKEHTKDNDRLLQEARGRRMFERYRRATRSWFRV